MTRVERLRQVEVWIAWVRILAVAWAVVEVGWISDDYPAGGAGAAFTVRLPVAL